MSTSTKKDHHKRLTILLIDDEQSWLESAGNLLKNESYNIIIANGGEDALTKLKQKKPDLILSDVRMPVMNGFELFEKIRENPTLKSVPFVFMSSIDDYDAKHVAKKLGADAYVEKPFETKDLKAVVAVLLSRFEKR